MSFDLFSGTDFAVEPDEDLFLVEGAAKNLYDYSILFDVHVWSDYPEINSAVEQILPEVLPPANADKMKYRRQLKVILLNLYYAFINDPELYIAYSRKSDSYKADSRYNALHLSYKFIINITDRLTELDYIEHKKGFKDRDSSYGRLSRMRATKKLQNVFANLKREMVSTHELKERIILKDDKKGLVDYVDTERIARMRNRLQRINQFLKAQEIKWDICPELFAFIQEERRKVHKAPIDLSKVELYRIFNGSKFNEGGRFYGGWWQLISEDDRKLIRINGEEVSERDYKSLHPTILYIQATGALPIGDPYQLDDYLHTKVMRKVAKNALLVMINAKTEKQALGALRKKFIPSMKNSDITLDASDHTFLDSLDMKAVMRAIANKHLAISKYLFAGVGRELQNKDAQIAEMIMIKLLKNGIPCLPIHDSFIVPRRADAILLEAMREEFKNVFRVYPFIE